MSSFVVQIDLALAAKLKEGLCSQGFEIFQPPHTLFQGKKKGVSCTLYASGKLMVQGKAMQEFIEFYLEPEILKTFTYTHEQHAGKTHDLTPRIGVDESGKGDFFGPLCVAGLYADETNIERLAKLGVKDSKRMVDNTILKIAQKLRKEFVHHILYITPSKYNELYEKFGNLNLLLGWGHATVIENLLETTGCEQVIIDQFAAEHVVENALRRKKKRALLTQRPRAEEDLVVAAASILARATFLKGLEKIGKEWHCELPKGASAKTIQVGKKLVTKHGPQILKNVAKLHFKTTQNIISN